MRLLFNVTLQSNVTQYYRLNNMQYTVNQAAKIVGITRQTIYRHIDKKPISVTLDDNDNQLIEASELMRVYGNDLDFDAINNNKKPSVTPPKLQDVTRKTANVTPDVEVTIQVVKLEAEVKSLKEQLTAKEDHSNYVEKLLEEEKAERKKANNLLEDHRSKESKWDNQFNQMENRLKEFEKAEEERKAADRQRKETLDLAQQEANRLKQDQSMLKKQLQEEKSKSWWDKLTGK